MFLLDVKYDYKNNQIVKWIKDKDNCKTIRETYYPKIYVSGINIPILLSLPGVKDAYIEEKLLLNGKKENVITCILEGNQIYNISSILRNANTQLEEKFKLYNIDIDITRKYLLEKNLFPMAKVKRSNSKNNDYEIDDQQFSLNYELPDVNSINLIIKDKDKKWKLQNNKICSIIIGDNILEGEEADIIQNLNQLICEIDPDIVLTESENSLEFLYHRAALNDIDLQLGREKDIFSIFAKFKERSYFSYGRIIYKPRMHLLAGRLHIDKSGFLFREGGLSGLIDISRITSIPLQECSRLSPGSAITALQVNQALRENIIIPLKRYNAEYWKTAEELLIADRGALVLEPKIGIHEDVYELDYSSLFPNIMVKYNISPETVLCDCCTDIKRRVPFIGYNICEKNIGLVPRVLKPLIERRMEYKRRSKAYKLCKDRDSKLISKEYDQKQNILKWLLVTSFGYMGFNKAVFGRIECHESITAYARDILLRTMELADNNNYEIIHGIVDCLWVKPRKSENSEKSENSPSIEILCEIASEEIGINLELKGKFNWIVFLPNKTNGAGSPGRYYGSMDNGELKIRGIEMRRSDSPLIIKNLQEDMLNKLAEAKNISQFYLKIPESINILKEYVKKIFSNDIDFDDLILQISISRECEDYVQFNNQVAALKQLKDECIEIKPGQSVRYIIADSKTKDYKKRVILPEFIDNNAQYDAYKYYQYLLKGAESILLPFGYTEEKLDEIINKRIQKMLKEYI